MGDFVLKIQGDQASLAQLAALLLFMERWGNLGAKAQVGYGAFALQDRETVAQFASRSSIGPVADAQEERVSLPNLQHFGFFRYRFRPPQPGWWTRLPGFERIVRQVQPLVETYQTVPLAPVLKNVWHFQYWQREWGDAGTFWGMLGRERIRGKVLVSWAYPHDDMWELHGSAWLHGVTVQPVWAMQSNGNNWNQVLGVQGSLETFPVGAWRPWTATTVHDFLKQAAHP